MIMGYGIIAVPTGIVTVELSQATQEESLSGNAVSRAMLLMPSSAGVAVKNCHKT
jgi:hypothetical protein